MSPLETMIDEQKRLLMGADPRPDATIIDPTAMVVRLPARGPLKSRDGEEILRGIRPSIRYGIGVLFPKRVPKSEESDRKNGPTTPDIDEVETPEVQERVENVGGALEEDGSTDDVTVEFKQVAGRPRSIGISFLVELTNDDVLEIELEGGRYVFHSVPVERVLVSRPKEDDPSQSIEEHPQHPLRLYQRSPLRINTTLTAAELDRPNPITRALGGDIGPLQLELYIRVREYSTLRLITATVINRAEDYDNDQKCFFQAHLKVRALRQGKPIPAFHPYPEPLHVERTEADASMDLLYHKTPRFAAGHGCAADWQTAADCLYATEISGEPMPVFLAPNITPAIPELMIQMRDLSFDDGLKHLENLVGAYERWCDCRSNEALPPKLNEAACRHLKAMKNAAKRMRAGLQLLEEDPQVRDAFKLANIAMRLQQISAGKKIRSYIGEGLDGPQFEPTFTSVLNHVPEHEPTWYGFQIGFLLANIIGITDPYSDDREIVELIWFPTGGGKTEAYLGLVAFASILARLRAPNTRPHVQVMMRYTMRLLTAQQFQRAASLFCALEVIRTSEDVNAWPRVDLGNEPFLLGIWVGAASTPNSIVDFAQARAGMLNGNMDEHLFVHQQCPWCAAEVNRLGGTDSGKPETGSRSGRRRRSASITGDKYILGLGQSNDLLYPCMAVNEYSYRCSDPDCVFHDSGLPLHIVDEMLLRRPPTLLISTVDKFAQLPKNPKLRALFGVDRSGISDNPPPSLIIQDELHLISEALGSMVGHFEPLIHYLCEGLGERPKIICSTATIRTYREQVRSLFARDNVALFPPPEFAVGESFFARFELDASGSVVRKKAYLGIFGSGHDSYQTAQSWTFASLLQAPLAVEPSSRDPFWTLLAYFNSLKELGTTLTLSYTQIRAALRSIASFRNLSWHEGTARSGPHTQELTARTGSADLMKALERLKNSYDTHETYDLCLATSIVEVGVDVPRLSNLVVVGQPKKTATYIQATGRVGRRFNSLVTTLYNHTRARDRSVYESFRAFHERMYAEVEPTSLTPFSLPVQERALPAVLAGYARQKGAIDELAASPSVATMESLSELLDSTPGSFPDVPGIGGLGPFLNYLSNWANTADPLGAITLDHSLRRRLQEWRDWRRAKWHLWNFQPILGQLPQMRDVDPTVSERERESIWFVPNSMREVDAEGEWWIDTGTWLGAVNMPGPEDDSFPRNKP